MIDTFFGTKLKPSRMFTEAGKSIPVTDVTVAPGTVVQVKTADKDGYTALQVGFDWRITKKGKQPEVGHLKTTGQGNNQPRFLREIKAKDDDASRAAASQIKVEEVFAVGDTVKVTAISKGKGFQGGVKRHGFRGGPRTHGQSDRERAPGSIGSGTTPGRVYRGKRMAGRMGNEQVTIMGLTVVALDTEKNILRVKGLIPGSPGTQVMIRKQIKAKAK